MATYIPPIELEETESPEALQLSVAEYYRDLLRRRKSISPPPGGVYSHREDGEVLRHEGGDLVNARDGHFLKWLLEISITLYFGWPSWPTQTLTRAVSIDGGREL